MYRHFVIAFAALAVMGAPLSAQTYQRRAVLTGGGNTKQGKCTIEVVVDGAADVEIRGDTATLRNLSGQPPQWRRFECTASMPANPVDLRFAGVDGRGRQSLIRDQRNDGVTVVRIEDSGGGAEGYTFDLIWSGGSGYNNDPNRSGRNRRDRDVTQQLSSERAVRLCQEAIRQQAAQRFNSPDIFFRPMRTDDNPGRRDWITGTFDVRSGRNDKGQAYQFSCGVDFANGQIRSAQIEPTRNGRDGAGYDGHNTRLRTGANEACQRAVEDRMRHDGYGSVAFGSIDVDNAQGRSDRIIGTARADRGNRSESFDFSCTMKLENGTVRSVDVRRR
jgi:hypothetical protein